MIKTCLHNSLQVKGKDELKEKKKDTLETPTSLQDTAKILPHSFGNKFVLCISKLRRATEDITQLLFVGWIGLSIGSQMIKICKIDGAVVKCLELRHIKAFVAEKRW